MATSLSVRNLDEDLIRRLKIRAAQNGRSAEAEHRAILHKALEVVAPPLQASGGSAFDERAAALRKKLTGRRHTPAEILQREGRDER